MQRQKVESNETLMTSLVEGVIEDYSQGSPTNNENSPGPQQITEKPSNIDKVEKEFLNVNQQLPNWTEQLDSGSSSKPWVWELISRMSGWLSLVPGLHDSSSHPETPLVPPTDIWKDWEWVLSKAEEISQKQSMEEAELIRKELRRLRQTANALKYRPFFHLASKDIMRKLGEGDIIDLNTVLEASESFRIISDVITALEDEWLEFIQKTFFPDTENISWQVFSANYKEKPYEKNVVGALKELAFSASHGPKNVGVNQRVLSDVMWSLWKTLTTSIRTAVDRELNKEELILVAKQIIKAQQPFIKLWIQTVKNSRLGKSKEGRLVKKWAIEEEDKETLKNKIKERGVDAKYEYKRYVPLTTTEDSNKNLQSIRELLEGKLSIIYAH